MYEVFIPKKLGKIFKNNRSPVDVRVLLVKSPISDINVYIYYRYSSIDPRLNDKARIAIITNIRSFDVDGVGYLIYSECCINHGIAYLIERCNYTEVWLPRRYSSVCSMSFYPYKEMYEHISFRK